jgi:hypothetical protein
MYYVDAEAFKSHISMPRRGIIIMRPVEESGEKALDCFL